ncbi:tyramine/octopamine receptor-like [Liolophura sinensis]|uniref:tyramine/octopamine receptor-like n=1 Tax=Liolophura sinensis TaxID=3198878 RepID=UPI0031588F28
MILLFSGNQSFPNFLNFSLDINGSYENFSTTLENDDTLAVTTVRLICVGFILCIIDVVALLGNVLVIVAVASTKRLKTVTNCFVVSLATADLLLSLSVMPLGIMVEMVGSWPLGAALCDMWISLDVLLCTASILNLCCISLDRYLAISRPLLYATKRSKRLALLMIFVVWCASVIVTCPPIFGWKEHGRYEHSNQCGLTKDPGYIIYSAMGSFFIPMLVMVFVYARIYKIVFDREKRLLPYRRSLLRSRTKKTDSSNSDENNVLLVMENRHTCSGRGQAANSFLSRNGRQVKKSSSIQNLPGCTIANQATTTFNAEVPLEDTHHRNYNSASKTPRRNIGADKFKDVQKAEKALILKEGKTAKSLAIVVGGFIICWLPFFCVYVLRAFCYTCNVSTRLFVILTWFGYFNSVINPFIYAFSNMDFRQAFWRLTFGVFVESPVAV